MTAAKGIIVPMVTPLLDEDTLDLKGCEKLVNHLIGGGVHGLFILGTTGEGPSLKQSLQLELVKYVCSEVGGRIPVLVGIMDASFKEAVNIAAKAEEYGAYAVVIAPPFFYQISQDELYSFTSRLYMGTMQEISPLLGKACGVHMAASRAKTEWMLPIQGKQGRELWFAHLKAGTPVVFTIGWPIFPLLGAATIEVRSEQGISADRWEGAGWKAPKTFDHPLMPKVTYQVFPFEEACPEIAVYPVNVELSDQPDHF